MLIIIAGIALIIYYILALRIKPHRFPGVPEEKVYEWQACKIRNSRRYAGLFVIYIIIAVVAGVLFNYALKHQYHALPYIILVVELAYVIFCIVYIVRTIMVTRRFKRQLFSH